MQRLFVALSLSLVTVTAVPAWADIQSSPIGASAECGDGMYSTSTGKGTCSGHGGVKRWLNGSDSSSSLGTETRSDAQVSPSFTDTSQGGGSGGSDIVSDTYTDTTVQSTSALPKTGGEPLLMSLFGFALAGGAAWGRRRLR